MGHINPAVDDEELQDRLALRNFQNIRNKVVSVLTDDGKKIPSNTEDRIFLTETMRGYETQYFAVRKAKREDQNDENREKTRRMAIEMLRALKSGVAIQPLAIEDRPTELPEEFRVKDLVPGEIEQQAGQAPLNYDDFIAANAHVEED